MTALSSPRKLVGFIASLFFFSGFAALVYQVVWMRYLSLFFGSDVYAAAITLSVFMGGLSLGSAVAERLVDKLVRPLLCYGLIEIAIGMYAFFFRDLLAGFAPLLESVYRTQFDAAPLVYQAVRIGVAALVLLVPATLMGSTLPLIVKSFVQRDAELGRFGGTFYAINTLGALAGTLICAFALVPFLGVAHTTLIAVAINLTIGTLVALISLQIKTQPSYAGDTASDEEPASAWRHDPAAARVALFAIAMSGLAALALEVIWIRILTLSFSGTVYSVAIMLASFLFGIFYGSRRAARMIDAHPDPVRFFGFVEIGLALSVALLGLGAYIAPKLSGALVWSLTAISQGNFAFGAIAAQFVVGGALIVVPAMLLGATFPAAVRVCTRDARHAGAGTGRVYAANTAGAVLGSLLAGFVLIPAMGSRASLVMLAAIFAANGCLLLWQSAGRTFSVLRHARAAITLGATIAAGLVVLILPHQTVANYGLQQTMQPELIYHGEGTAHSVDIVRSSNGNIIMMVDGNTEADTSFIQRRHFILKGHLPLLLHPAPREVAVVGLGLGITLSATEHNPEVQSIEVIELTPEMPRAHERLDEVTGGVLRSPKIHLRIDDGRNFLAMSERKFDMITADPIHPRISGVGYLYSEEYYRTLKRRLNPGGVVCQWMPMYSISRRSFDVAFRTFSSVFENASFWYVRGHGLFVATEQPFTIDYSRLKQRAAAPAVAKDLASIEIADHNTFLAHLLMGPAQIRKYLAASGDSTLNTDDNAYLEYFTPFEFLDKTKSIVIGMEPFAGFDPGLLVNITDAERAEVQLAWKSRHARLLTELDEPLR
jgi:spermidine synthase